MKHRNFGQTGRGAFGTSHGAGKGDVERSSKWRDKYDDVEWPHSEEGFTKRGSKLIKKYGVLEPEKNGQGPHIQA